MNPLPCRKCGHTLPVVVQDETSELWKVQCPGCHLDSSLGFNADAAVVLWNALQLAELPGPKIEKPSFEDQKKYGRNY